MNLKKHNWILYLIIVTIITTIGVQFYWNYKNYEENKTRVTNEITISLDNAFEEYYASIAKDNFITILKSNRGKNDSQFLNTISFDSLFNTSSVKEEFKNRKTSKIRKEKTEFAIKSIEINSNEKQNQQELDSFIFDVTSHVYKEIENDNKSFKKEDQLTYFKGKKAADSLKLINTLEPIFISMTSHFIEYDLLDSLFLNQLQKKKIAIAHSFQHLKNDTLFFKVNDSLLNKNFITVNSKSTYLKDNEKFQLLFNNPSIEALKRSSTGILLSLILSIIIISSLFFLLKTINQQKELAEIKNDLISNITHEFKTPITTVSTAIEAIQNFDVLNDKVKTQKYLSMSFVQLKKLHQMVEKLLETATLDSEKLMLKKEDINLVDLIDKLVNKHQIICKEKPINFSSNVDRFLLSVDVFHLENAVSNLIDNAVKYGGDKIEVRINIVFNVIEITVSDNGIGIEKHQQEKIFNKFYRVPKGNTHNVKGFGIGLYYTKSIIEKHHGNVQLSINNKNTIFKITLPNG